MFSSLLQTICLKGSNVWRFVISNKIIVTLDTQGSGLKVCRLLSSPVLLRKFTNANYVSLFATELVDHLLVSDKSTSSCQTNISSSIFFKTLKPEKGTLKEKPVAGITSFQRLQF